MYNPITVFKVKDTTLTVVYDKTYSGLYEHFSSDDRMYEYIQHYTEEAFLVAVNKIEDNNYILNIASTHNLGAFEWHGEKELLNRQLSAFMPIINRFIVDVLTDSFKY